MKKGGWSYICASVIGSKHSELGLPCQDASDCKLVQSEGNNEILIAVTSDGAGSAQQAQIGAATACTSFINRVRKSLDDVSDLSFLTEEYIKKWIDDFQCEIETLARQHETSIREFACTFVTGVIGKDQAIFSQIGDGGIVILEDETNESYKPIFWPQQGQFANQTNFLTDKNAVKNLMFTTLSQSVREVALFTDGMQNLVLHEETQTAHSPFFRPIFAALRKSDAGHAEALQNGMIDYLMSPKVTERTDDDKTLIFATSVKAELTE